MRSFLLLLFLTLTLFSETLEVGSKEYYKTKDYMRYLLVSDDAETPLELIDKKWEKDKSTFNNLRNFDKAYWVKLVLKNSSSEFKTYYLKSENQFTYHIEFFLVKVGQVVTKIEDGVISKNQHREFNTNHMIFPITLKPYEEATVFFKILNYNKIDIDFILANKDYLLDFYQTYNLLEGIFFGGMLVLLFYNFFLYILLRFRAYLYYILYTFWLSVYFTGVFGFSQRYFPEYTGIFYMSSGAFFVFMTLFIQSILNLKEQLPNIYKVLNIFITYFIIATFINIYMLEVENFFYAQVLFNLFFTMVPLYAFIVITVTYYLAYIKKDSVAKIYSWIWTLVSLVGLLLPLNYLNIFETDISSDYIFQFLMFIEVLCFSLILAYKIKLMQKEQAKQKMLLVEQNKLASMGEMISSIAHQWRQPLSEINGVVLNMDIDYRKERLNRDRFDYHLNSIEDITSHLSRTIHDFMNLFSYNKDLEKFSLMDAIRSSERLLSMSGGKKVSLVYTHNSNIEIVGYRSELIQALLIVINNSIDAAMENNVLAMITINFSKKKDNRVIINIEDNGGGISTEIEKNIFNPYFTTKHESQGTGLGLYILKMIIEKSMSGSVQIFNKNRGVNCEIVIPINLGNIVIA